MNKEKIDVFPLGLIVFMIIFGILATALLIFSVYDYANAETIIVEGKIIDTDYYTESVGGMTTNRFINLTFETEEGIETYKIFLDEDYYDFTVNSKFIFELRKGGTSSHWDILKIIKVPDNLEEG